ncbi:Pentatricopeptide repeat-containing protein [Sesamum angolense]|uniref:Pentatricopeptide repeat-containing protein n=1 Tax=Sesamum angolense TaxID=2727404 RepID=A0AAE1W317_9LAMI|nr:Pentatricopeptide repeat-containing protein [Sesamum angolense]
METKHQTSIGCPNTKQAQSTFDHKLLGPHVKTDHFMVDCCLTTLKDFASRDSLSSLLLSCTNFKLLSEGRQLHAQVITWSLQKNHTLVPKLVSLYAAFGLLDNAYFIVTDSHILHPFPWNILISSYVSKGHFEEAIFAYEQMAIRQIRPDNFSYTYVLEACAEQSNLDLGKRFIGNFKGALKLICQMRMSGHHLNPVALIIGLCACSRICALKWGKQFMDWQFEVLLWTMIMYKNALITLYSRCGDLMHAYVVFTLIEATNVITWNSIISGFAQWDRCEEARFLFRELLLIGIEPSYVTLAGILPLARVANLQHGKEFHCYIAEEFQGYLLIWNALIEMGMGSCEAAGNEAQISGYYVLIANMYSSCCWLLEQTGKSKDWYEGLGVRKDPECAWVDMGAGFSPFLVEDTSEGQTNEIVIIL